MDSEEDQSESRHALSYREGSARLERIIETLRTRDFGTIAEVNDVYALGQARCRRLHKSTRGLDSAYDDAVQRLRASAGVVQSAEGLEVGGSRAAVSMPDEVSKCISY